MVTNPLDNAVLQGRFDTYPMRRGHTRVKELHGGRASTSASATTRSWTRGTRSGTATRCRRVVLAHYGQMSGDDELLTADRHDRTERRRERSASRTTAWSLGAAADLVVFDAPSEMDAVRLVPSRRAVIRAGKVVARAEPTGERSCGTAGRSRSIFCARADGQPDQDGRGAIAIHSWQFRPGVLTHPNATNRSKAGRFRPGWCPPRPRSLIYVSAAI